MAQVLHFSNKFFIASAQHTYTFSDQLKFDFF